MSNGDKYDPSDDPDPALEPTRSSDDLAASPSLGAFPSVAGYEIVRKLGEGGMGIVYEAEQRNPRRRVALKVIRSGELIDESRARMFQREANVLALLKHPNIGAIYESGRTEGGQPYFSMELVLGETLDAYLRRRGLVNTQAELVLRLVLFRQIVDAVTYAHQRGVIHRDLKPSNIIVTPEDSAASAPVAKILDFGLARITEGDLAPTQVTEVGVIKGTLAYMAPEQARGNSSEIDVRADVYALGVILYEMLSGKRPYDISHRPLLEAVRIICEERSAPLRQVVSGLRRLDPDLETIVGKAMEKETSLRYATAAGLSEDVGRYLSSQPILARPPSTMYQLRKFASRNKALVAGLAATVFMLMVAVAGTTTGLIQARSAQAEAERENATAQRLSDFMNSTIDNYDAASMGATLRSGLFERLRAHGGDAERVNMVDVAQGLLDKEILQHAVATIDREFADDPDLAQRAHFRIGHAYFNLQLYASALKQFTRSLELIRLIPDSSLAEESWILAKIGDCQRRLSHYTLAERAYVDALAGLTALKPVESAGELHRYARGRYSALEETEDEETASRVLREYEVQLKCSLGDTYRYAGRYEKAARLLTETLAEARSTLGDDHQLLLPLLNDLALALRGLGRHDEALSALREVMSKSTRVYGDEGDETLIIMSNLGDQLREMGRVEEAEKLLTKAIGVAEQRRGSAAWITLMTQRRLGNLYRASGRLDDAESLLRETLATMTVGLGEAQEDTLLTRMELASLLAARRKFAEAQQLLQQGVASIDENLADDPDLAQRAHFKIGQAYLDFQRFDPALKQFTRSLELIRRVPDPILAEKFWILARIGDCQRRLSHYTLAENAYQEALAGLPALEETEDEGSAWVAHAGVRLKSCLGDTYRYAGRHEKAVQLLTETLEEALRTLGDDHHEILEVLNNLALALQSVERHDEALSALREALSKSRRVHGEEHDDTLNIMSNLGNHLRIMGRFEEAETLLTKALAISRRRMGDTALFTLGSQHRLGVLYRASGRVNDAEPLLRETLTAMRESLGEAQSNTLATRIELASLLADREDFEKARRLLDDNLRALGPDAEPGRKIQTLYNLACVEAQRGNSARAMKLLDEAIAAGFNDATKMSKESRLTSLRGPAFEAIVVRVRHQREE